MNENTKKIVAACLNGYQFRLKDRTLEAYEQNINEFFSFHPGDFQEIKPADIRKWVLHLQEKGRKPATVHQKLASLRLLFGYLLEEQLISQNPMSKIASPKMEDKLPYYLSREQLGELRNLVKDSKRERAIIETFYTTGVRSCELIDMQKNDISWDERTIHIREGKGKKERIVLFSHGCKEILLDYLSTRKDELPHLFLNSKRRPLQGRALRLTFEGYSERLGFKVTQHTMRHTFAAHLAEKNMPLSYIQDLLGHDTIEVTKIYARLHEEARKKQYDYYS